MLLSTVLALSLLGGCGGEDKNIKNHSQEFRREEDAEAVYGEVSKVAENVITIKVGTQKKNEQPGENSSMLDLTGEEQEIQITENTVIKRQSMRGGPGKLPENEQSPRQSNGEAPSGDPPEQPNGEAPSGNPPEQPDGNVPSKELSQQSGTENHFKDNTEEISISDISEGDAVRVIFAEDGSAKEFVVLSGDRNGNGMNLDSQPESYKAVKEYNEELQMEGVNISSEGTDENAILISENANAELKNFTISRKSQDSTGGDSSSFYGVGAAVLAKDGTAYISKSIVETDAAGGAGIFAYGDGTIIEGLNSLRLYHSALTGTMGEDQRNDCTWNVFVRGSAGV